ncbi:MAG: right-handed parallel beta-helix repeat-containing protein [Candidatus Binatia bacterium]
MDGRTRVAAWLMALLALVPVRAVGSVFFVDPQGSDSTGGSATQPLRTIGRAASLAQQGDAVVVNPGTYQESVILPRSGAPTASIVFQGLPGAVMTSPDPAASLSAFDVGANAYVTVEGFEMTGGFDETVFVRPGAHDVELFGLHIHGNHTGIWIAGASNVTVSDSVIDHNFRTGVRIFAGANHIRVADTRAEANDDGMSCDGESDGFNADDSTSDVTFERASALGNSQDGIDLQGPNMTLRQVTAQGNNCAGVKIAAGGYLENVLVYGSSVGVDVNSPPGATTSLENCTLSQNDVGLRVIGAGHTVAVHNSIIAGPAKAIDYTASVQLLEDYNIVYRPLSMERVIVREEADGSETLYTGDDVDSGKWQRESGQGGDTLFSDPDMQPLSGALLPGSPAIDSGTDAGAPAVDLVGTPRPLRAAVDRGALEWIPTAPTLRLGRTVARGNGSGTGSIKLAASLSPASSVAFDPSVDGVSVSIVGARGDVFGIDIPPTGWEGSPKRTSTLLRLRSNPANTSLTVRRSRGTVALQLSAQGIDLSVINDNQISVTVALGPVQAGADATLRSVGRLLRYP